MKTRNYELDFWKFIFTIIVILLHFDTDRFTGGYLGVDFFFICSGYFIFSYYEKRKVSPGEYFIHRIKQLYPYYFLGLILCIFYNCASVFLRYRCTLQSLSMVWRIIISEIFEIFGLQMMGFTEFWGNFLLWYVAVIVFCGHFIYYLLWINKKFIMDLIFPMMVFIGYALIYQHGGTLGLDYNVNFIFCFLSGIWRGISGLCLGVLISYHEKNLLIYKKIRQGIVAFIYILSIVVCFYLMVVTYHSKYDFIFPFVVSIIIFLSGKVVVFKEINGYLGRVIIKMISYQGTYIMYTLSRFFINIFWREWPYELHSWSTYLIFIILLILFSIIIEKIMPLYQITMSKLLIKTKEEYGLDGNKNVDK